MDRAGPCVRWACSYIPLPGPRGSPLGNQRVGATARARCLQVPQIVEPLERVLLAPIAQRLQHRTQRTTFLGQAVLGPRRVLLVEPALDDAPILQRLETCGESR